MIAELGLVLQSLRVLSDIAKAVKNLDERAKIVEAVFDTQEKLMATSLTVAKLDEENAALKDENKKFKNWEREAERYTLVEVIAGVTAFTPKPGMENGEAAHYLCANCFARREKSFLAQKPLVYGALHCGICKSDFLETATLRKATARMKEALEKN